jgi:serine/threonine protein kinase
MLPGSCDGRPQKATFPVLEQGYNDARMALSSGTKLGPYEILAPLGAGGMGEVYRARDVRLGRDVALKTLPETLVADPEHMVRFEREAQVLATFNHPNIASIYGLEESNGVRALVMELVEGPTLAERIASRAIAMQEALHLAREVAEALEAAHEKGIIHRDLKPINIKVTSEGKVKVLDFGLAKAWGTGAFPTGLSDSPTIPAENTRQGLILGTAAYMSPEQARFASIAMYQRSWNASSAGHWKKTAICVTSTLPRCGQNSNG